MFDPGAQSSIDIFCSIRSLCKTVRGIDNMVENYQECLYDAHCGFIEGI